MSIRELLAEASARLAEAGVASPAHDARVLLAHVLDVPLTRLNLVDGPEPEQRARFDELVTARVARTPLQHLTGTVGFRHVELLVGPGVFVPRPETEHVAGWAIDAARQLDNPVIVDLCTGSGAIALAVHDELPGASVHAVELGEDAFAWAQQNLAGTGIDLRHGDMVDAFDDLDGTVDVVVSNPPYIPLEAWESVEPEVRDHDPHLALFSGQDGLEAIRILEGVAHRLLKPGGVVVVEHADVQREGVVEVFQGRWTQVVDHDDLAGKPRFVTAVRSA